MRHEIFSWDMRFSHETGDRRFSCGGAVWENVLSHEKISCLISLGSPSTRKSLVSCLMRKSHDPGDNLMSFQYRVPPNEKIFCLLSHEKISCPKRKSHVFSVLAPPNEKISCLLSHEKISCLKRKSHVLSVLGPPPTRKSPVSCLKRKSPVSWEILMCDAFSINLTRKSHETWDSPCEGFGKSSIAVTSWKNI